LVIVPDPDDRRGVLVRLTVSGRRKIDLVAADLAETEALAWHQLGARKSDQLDAVVTELIAHLES